MPNNKFHQVRYFLWGAGGFLLIVSLALMASAITNHINAEEPIGSGDIFMAFLLLLITIVFWGVFLYFRRDIYSSFSSAKAYEVSFSSKDGAVGVDMVRANYLAKNLMYMMALQNPGRRFSIIITDKNNQKPIFISDFSKEQIVAFVGAGKDFVNLNIRLKEIDVRHLLGAGKYYYCLLKDDTFSKDTPNINVSDLIKDSDGAIEAVYINMCYKQNKNAQLPTGNIVVRVKADAQPKGEGQDARQDIVAILNNHLHHISIVMVLGNHPFVKLYDGLYKSLVKIILSDTIIEAVAITKFSAVRNFNEEYLSQKKWVVATSGENYKSPVYLRKNTLVLQDYPGLSNPANIWMNTMIQMDNLSSFIAIDLDGSITATAKSMNADLIMNRDIAIIKTPTEAPEYIINLLSLWPGVSEEYSPEMVGALLVYCEKFIRYIFPYEAKVRQDQMAVILQGSILTILESGTDFDLANFIVAMKDVPAPIQFLKNIHKMMHMLVYENEDYPMLSRIWITMNELGHSINYNATLANQEATAANMGDLNTLHKRLSPFLSEPGNLLICNSESRYSPAEYRNIIFDLSSWDGNMESLTLEYLLAGVFYTQFIRQKFGLPPTSLMISGISRLGSEGQAVAVDILADYIRSTEYSDFSCLVADRKAIHGYVKMFSAKLFNDMFVFRLQEAEEVRDLLAKTKTLESVYTLPKQTGYIFRLSSDKSRLIPGNVYTARPQIVN